MRRIWWTWCLIGLAACGSGGSPATTDVLEPVTTADSTTTTAGPPVVTGEFSISNTSAGGGPVLIETMEVTVEYAADGTWVVLPAVCWTKPAAPVTVEEELTVSYACAPQTAAPEGARLRGVVEATIFGSDEVFRMETEAEEGGV